MRPNTCSRAPIPSRARPKNNKGRKDLPARHTDNFEPCFVRLQRLARENTFQGHEPPLHSHKGYGFVEGTRYSPLVTLSHPNTNTRFKKRKQTAIGVSIFPSNRPFDRERVVAASYALNSNLPIFGNSHRIPRRRVQGKTPGVQRQRRRWCGRLRRRGVAHVGQEDVMEHSDWNANGSSASGVGGIHTAWWTQPVPACRIRENAQQV